MNGFKLDDKVKIHSTTSKELDGSKAKVCGVTSSHPEVTFYIIELQEPYMGWTHISLSDACLVRD
jgi:hypothetical protein